MTAMLARARNGKIHNKDCRHCNDGFSKINALGRGRIRKSNRKREDRIWRKDWKV